MRSAFTRTSRHACNPISQSSFSNIVASLSLDPLKPRHILRDSTTATGRHSLWQIRIHLDTPIAGNAACYHIPKLPFLPHCLGTCRGTCRFQHTWICIAAATSAAYGDGGFSGQREETGFMFVLGAASDCWSIVSQVAGETDLVQAI